MARTILAATPSPAQYIGYCHINQPLGITVPPCTIIMPRILHLLPTGPTVIASQQRPCTVVCGYASASPSAIAMAWCVTGRGAGRQHLGYPGTAPVDHAQQCLRMRKDGWSLTMSRSARPRRRALIVPSTLRTPPTRGCTRRPLWSQ